MWRACDPDPVLEPSPNRQLYDLIEPSGSREPEPVNAIGLPEPGWAVRTENLAVGSSSTRTCCELLAVSPRLEYVELRKRKSDYSNRN